MAHSAVLEDPGTDRGHRHTRGSNFCNLLFKEATEDSRIGVDAIGSVSAPLPEKLRSGCSRCGRRPRRGSQHRLTRTSRLCLQQQRTTGVKQDPLKHETLLESARFPA